MTNAPHVVLLHGAVRRARSMVALERALAALPGRKVIYTNATTRHAEAVMARLGVAHHFEAVYDIVAADFHPKPDRRSYDALIRRHAIRPERACMIEDMARNLLPAAALGMTTVWVRTQNPWGEPPPDHPHPHPAYHVIENLGAWLAALSG